MAEVKEIPNATAVAKKPEFNKWRSLPVLPEKDWQTVGPKLEELKVREEKAEKDYLNQEFRKKVRVSKGGATTSAGVTSNVGQPMPNNGTGTGK